MKHSEHPVNTYNITKLELVLIADFSLKYCQRGCEAAINFQQK